MASLLSCPTLPSRLLQLPPALRAATYQTATALRSSSTHVKRPSSPSLSASPSTYPRRAFSATASRPAPSINEIVVSPFTFVLDSIHAVGLPWYAAIPAAAVLFRSTVGYYFSALPARKRQIARWSIMPLITSRIRVSVMEKEHEFYTRNDKLPKWGLALARLVATIKGNLIYAKYFKVPHFTSSSFVGFGLLIGFGEAIRIKCGASKGMLALIVDSAKALVANEEPAVPYEGMSKDEYLADRLYKWQEAQEAQAAASGKASSIAAPAAPEAGMPPMYTDTTNSYTDLLDPSLKTEGFLWFQDLTLPDPTLALPIMFGAAIALNALTRPKALPRPSKSEMMEQHMAKLEQLQVSGSSNSARSKSDSVAVQPISAKAAEEVRVAMQTAEKLEKERQIVIRRKQPYFARLPLGTRMQLAGGFIFAMLATHFPVAILLYVIPSMLTTFLQKLWLNAKHPLHEQITPCKRPMRVKLRREYVDKMRTAR